MINYLSLFSGIGAFEKALKNLNIGFNLVGYCEIDKYASKAYSLIHGVPQEKNYGDITKILEAEIPLPIDLIMVKMNTSKSLLKKMQVWKMK